MNKLAKFAILPALVLGGAFFGSSALATDAAPDLTEQPSLAEQLDALFTTENPSGVFDIDITAKEKDVACDISMFSGPNTLSCTPVGEEVLSVIKGYITEADITISDDFVLDVYLDRGYTNYGIYRWVFSVRDVKSGASNDLVYSKPFRTKYADTVVEGTEKQNAIREKFDNSKLQQLFCVYDEDECATDRSKHADGMKELLRSQIGEEFGDLDIYFYSIGAGVNPDVVPVGTRQVYFYYFYVFSDDLYLTYGAIDTYVMEGFRLEDGTVVGLSELYDFDDIYQELRKKLTDEGHGEIVYAAEMELVGEHEGLITITLNVGTEYNGKTVVILHKRDDGTYEEWQRDVVDGKVTIVTDSLSPFMVALKGANTPEIQDPVYGTTGGSTGSTGGATSGTGSSDAGSAGAPDSGRLTKINTESIATNAMIVAITVLGAVSLIGISVLGKKIIQKHQA